MKKSAERRFLSGKGLMLLSMRNTLVDYYKKSKRMQQLN
jgi:hypothetical protein